MMGDPIVRNDEVVGSIPTSSTNLLNGLATIAAISVNLKKPTYWTVMDRVSERHHTSIRRTCGTVGRGAYRNPAVGRTSSPERADSRIRGTAIVGGMQ
jgi:uncharacterized protein YcfJ